MERRNAIVTGRAWTPAGEISVREEVAAVSLSVALIQAESNLRMESGSMEAHFIEVQASFEAPVQLEEAA